jgi:hypothetical protein
MRRWLGSALALAVIAVALWPIATLARIFAARFGYPLDLEWCEGGTLLHAHRLLHGEPLYTGPGEIFAPFPYPPVFPALVAALGGFGLDYWTGRLVSILAIALFGALVFEAAFRSARGRLAGVAAGAAAVALVAVAFPASGGWFDLVRVDSTMLALAALGARLADAERPSTARLVAAAVALALAAFTKQTATLFAVWVVAFVFARDRRAGLRLAVATFGLSALALGLLQWTSGGRFWSWIVSNLGEHGLQAKSVGRGLGLIHEFAPFAVLLPAGFAALAERKALSRASVLWFGMLATALPVGLVPFAKPGGYVNNLMPILVLVGPVAVLLAHDALRRLERWRPPLAAAAAALFALLVALRPIEVARFVPDAAQRARAAELNGLVAGLEGGVLMPELPFVPVRNGQATPQWHVMSYEDLVHAGRGPDVAGVARRTGARWLIVSKKDRWPQLREVKRGFRTVRRLPEQVMTTGVKVTVDLLLELDPDAPAPPATTEEVRRPKRRRPPRPGSGPS